LYDLTDDQHQSTINENLIRDLEEQYYLKHPEIKTMDEFAKKREELDAFKVN
jgi:hypothetical protein